ncbi:hypothetical protein SAMN04487965_0599 [Microbulbifer donghaiensis]|uniref:Uncharacterized protein n=1 Tax=Microbulbifer donghaiensis TaxID=494016 RepID=A0A1M4W530_9GAMM|nr:hypothetical protein [Microbulbifer donghaiensis]SHE76250.1 hypothetical protein SAMN04487965_0599 [Microbulbifer donghaiensis]
MERLLKKSYELEAELGQFFQLGLRDDSANFVASHAMCSLAFEYAESVKYLVAAEKYNAAISLLRLQFEVLVKGMWCLYSAPEKAIENLFTPISIDNFKQLNKTPGLSQMLEELEGKAPREATSMLNEFKECHWQPLCSFVHGGVFAFQTHAIGFPPSLILNMLQTSNAISTMVAMLMIILSGDIEQRGKLTELQRKYADCLPILLPA